MSPTGSASAIIGVTVDGYHLLHIEGYSRIKEDRPTGEFIRSRHFTAGDLTWRVEYYPNGRNAVYAEFISVSLVLETGFTTTFKARVKFSLLDQAGEPVPSHTRTTSLCDYSRNGFGHGFHDFIKREFLEKSEHLKDDCFKIRYDVIILMELLTEDRAPFIAVPPSDLSRHLGDLLEAQDGVDVTFHVAGETFRAHRNILAYRSPVFKAELFGEMKESTATGDSVRIDDILPEVFKALLHFIYTDSLPDMEKHEVAATSQHLLVAADRYDMQRLKLICEDRLCRHLDVSNVATTLVLAEQHHCRGLKEACIEFLKSPHVLPAVVATDGFEHLTKTCPALVKELMCKLGAH